MNFIKFCTQSFRAPGVLELYKVQRAELQGPGDVLELYKVQRAARLYARRRQHFQSTVVYSGPGDVTAMPAMQPTIGRSRPHVRGRGSRSRPPALERKDELYKVP